MSDVACSPIFALDDRSATKVVKEEYFFQLGELIKRSGLDSKVKVERRGSGTVISIEEAYDAFSHHEKDDVVGTPDLEGQFATQQREGFAGMYRVVQKEPCRVQWGKGRYLKDVRTRRGGGGSPKSRQMRTRGGGGSGRFGRPLWRNQSARDAMIALLKCLRMLILK